MSLSFIRDIKFLILTSFILRFLLCLLPPLEIDQSGWRFWSQRMVELGPSLFYSRDIFTDNPPGFLYVFWLMGEIKNFIFPNLPYNSILYDLLLKLPTNIADILTGYLIYKIIRTKLNNSISLFSFIAYVFNPAVFFNSSIIGQFDGSAFIFTLLTIYFLVTKKNPYLAAFTFALSWSIKPQSIAVAPIIGLTYLINYPLIKNIYSFFIFLISILLIYLPFFPTKPFYGIIYVNTAMTNIFYCTSCFTFNFWGIFGNWLDDRTKFYNVSLTLWGILLTLLSFIPIFFIKPFYKRYHQPYIYLTAALSILAFFTFTTRMHERYIFPFFGFLLIAALLLKSKKLLIFYATYSIFNVFNLYFPYAYYNKHLNLTPEVVRLSFEYFNYLSFIGFIFFIILFVIFILIVKSNKTYAK